MMKCARIITNQQPLEIVDIATPQVKGNEVLVKVQAAGICHSDLHIWQGHYDLGEGQQLDLSARGVPLPLTPGHEIAGVIEKTGESVQHVKTGDPVVVYPWLGCGFCEQCLEGLEHLCATPQSLGVFQDGGYAQYIKVPHAKYLVDAQGLNLEVAATLTCSALTAYSAIKKAKAGALNKLAIIGIGGLGSIAVQLAKSLTECEIIAIDRQAEKLKIANEMGADHCVLLDDHTITKVKQLTAGVDTVIDFVGAENTAQLGADLVAKAGRLIIVGLVGGKFSLPLPYFPLKALTVQGSYTGSCTELRELVALARRQKITPFISKTYTLDDVNTALHDLTRGKSLGRTVLKL